MEIEEDFVTPPYTQRHRAVAQKYYEDFDGAGVTFRRCTLETFTTTELIGLIAKLVQNDRDRSDREMEWLTKFFG